jgi:formamidopyrimidine-DNA glycosylase
VPELPEVETTRRGIAPYLVGRRLVDWTLRVPALRWPLALPEALRGQRITAVRRRAKYLLIDLESGSLILHLGMSGSLRILPPDAPLLKHDHVDLVLDGEHILRLNDPRRFGSLHWQPAPAEAHWLLAGLGVEPLGDAFDGAALKSAAKGRRVAVKHLLMDSRVVVGVGNIYANEALFMARIRPTRAAGRISLAAYGALASAIREVLGAAIEMGGTTLRDFLHHDGQPGYFKQSLWVYGREDEPCKTCGSALVGIRLGQRATVYCRSCQPAR